MLQKKFFILLILLFIVIIFAENYQAYSSSLTNFQIVTENKYLTLYLNHKNTQFALKNKEDGNIWFSNPPDSRNFNELIAIEYYTPSGRGFWLDSYNDSVKYEQFKINEIENGFKIEYVLGEKWKAEDYFPLMLSKESFEEKIIEKIARENDKKLFLDNYFLLSLDKLTADRKRLNISFLNEENKERLFKEYTLIMHEPGYSFEDSSKKNEIVSTLLNHYRRNRQDIETIDDITHYDLKHLINNPTYVLKQNVISWDINDMIAILQDIGYTPEDKIIDHLDNNLPTPKEAVDIFKVPLYIYLDKQDLVVKIPGEEIYYPREVISKEHGVSSVGGGSEMAFRIRDLFGTIEGGQEVTFPLHNIRVLPYFGVPARKEAGYIFVPEGTGALININQYQRNSYVGNVFGRDNSFPQDNYNYRKNINLPIYGVKEGARAYLAIIEKGASQASIIAETTIRQNQYDRVFSEFKYIPRTILDLPGNIDRHYSAVTTFPVYQERPIEGDIQLRFNFLGEEEANYVGMAAKYRQYLLNNNQLNKLAGKENIPLYLELIGAITRQQPVMGLPLELPYALTSYQEAKKILTKIPKSVQENLRFKYSGWLVGGIEHLYPSRVKLEKRLGDEINFKELVSYIKAGNIEFFPAVDFLIVRKNTLLNDFKPSRDAVRFLDQNIAVKNNFNLITNKVESKEGVLLSLVRLNALIDNFLKSYRSFGINALALNEMGTHLHSDFRREHLVDIRQSKNIIIEQLAKLKGEENLNLLIEGGNAYSLPFVNNIINFPLTSIDIEIVDQKIPFYQIVIHGYIDYAGAPFNLASNIKENILKSLETGAYPYYLWTYAESVKTKNTNFDYLYNTNYKEQLATAISMYEKFNEILAPVYNQKIVGHEKVAENVYKTTFENEMTIVVDYKNHQVKVSGDEIQEKRYELSEEGLYEIP